MMRHTLRSANLFLEGRMYAWCKLCYAAPMIPFILIVSNHKKFKIGLHVMTGLVMIDTLEYKWLFLYALPLLIFIYKSNMYKLQKRLGRVESIRSGVIVNEHQFDLRSLSDVLTCPFIGCVLSPLVKIEDRVWRYLVSIFVYVIGKDMVCVYFLVCDKRRIKTMEVVEFRDES